MNKQLVTPAGIVKFPKKETKVIGDKTETKYTLSIVLDPKDEGVQKFIDDLNRAYDESEYPKSKGRVKEDSDKTEEVDKDGKPVYKPNGKYLVSFLSKFPISYFDSKKQKITDLELPGYGSKVRVNFNIVPIAFHKCMAKYINGIQVIDLKSGGPTADSCGFNEEEGFTAPTNEEEPWAE